MQFTTLYLTSSGQPKHILTEHTKENKMESTFFRGMVLFLALTGFGASRTTSAKAPTSAKATSAMKGDPGSPMPTCPPNDPNGCGIL
jgi:hypothetical protein